MNLLLAFLHALGRKHKSVELRLSLVVLLVLPAVVGQKRLHSWGETATKIWGHGLAGKPSRVISNSGAPKWSWLKTSSLRKLPSSWMLAKSCLQDTFLALQRMQNLAQNVNHRIRFFFFLVRAEGINMSSVLGEWSQKKIQLQKTVCNEDVLQSFFFFEGMISMFEETCFAVVLLLIGEGQTLWPLPCSQPWGPSRWGCEHWRWFFMFWVYFSEKTGASNQRLAMFVDLPFWKLLEPSRWILLAPGRTLWHSWTTWWVLLRLLGQIRMTRRSSKKLRDLGMKDSSMLQNTLVFEYSTDGQHFLLQADEEEKARHWGSRRWKFGHEDATAKDASFLS